MNHSKRGFSLDIESSGIPETGVLVLVGLRSQGDF